MAQYVPGTQSRRYQQLAPDERAAVNAEVDRQFRARHPQVKGSLDWSRPEHKDLAREWLRIRDQVMATGVQRVSFEPESIVAAGPAAPPRPGTGRPVSSWTTIEKVEECVLRSLPLMPDEVGDQIAALLSPESLGIMVGTLVIWAGSHFFGIGEIVDVILLAAGFAFLGSSVYGVAKDLYAFGTGAVEAESEADLDAAAGHFARAVIVGGVDIITAVLLRRSAKAVMARKPPVPFRRPGLLKVGPEPAAPPKITRPPTLASGSLGETGWYGDIAVSRAQIPLEQRLTLFHEWVHSVLSPRLGPLRQLRANLKASAYWRSALMRYLEEAMAESYAQLRVRGFSLENLWKGVTFPIDGGYVTVTQLVNEGVAIGNIMLGGRLFSVYVSDELPKELR